MRSALILAAILLGAQFSLGRAADELHVYPPVPGLDASAHYQVRIRSNKDGAKWQAAFAWQTECKNEEGYFESLHSSTTMKTPLRLLASLVLTPLATICVRAESTVPAKADAPSKDTQSFLFLGNSFTMGHQLPTLFAALAQEDFPGTSVKTEIVAPAESEIHSQHQGTLRACKTRTEKLACPKSKNSPV
jgi:hypothetical protein